MINQISIDYKVNLTETIIFLVVLVGRSQNNLILIDPLECLEFRKLTVY